MNVHTYTECTFIRKGTQAKTSFASKYPSDHLIMLYFYFAVCIEISLIENWPIAISKGKLMLTRTCQSRDGEIRE